MKTIKPTTTFGCLWRSLWYGVEMFRGYEYHKAYSPFIEELILFDSDMRMGGWKQYTEVKNNFEVYYLWYYRKIK